MDSSVVNVDFNMTPSEANTDRDKYTIQDFSEKGGDSLSPFLTSKPGHGHWERRIREAF